MENNDKKIERILKPHSVMNWAHLNFRRTDDTALAIRTLANSPFFPSLRGVYGICFDLAKRSITIEEALNERMKKKSEYTIKMGNEIIPVFDKFITERQIVSEAEIGEKYDQFQLSRDFFGSSCFVPVKPNFICIIDGKLTPVFLFGWSKMDLTPYQKQLCSTIINMSILTQQDFINSDAMIITIPRIGKTRTREVRYWRTRSYGTLSADDLADQAGRYIRCVRQVLGELGYDPQA